MNLPLGKRELKRELASGHEIRKEPNVVCNRQNPNDLLRRVTDTRSFGLLRRRPSIHGKSAAQRSSDWKRNAYRAFSPRNSLPFHPSSGSLSPLMRRFDFLRCLCAKNNFPQAQLTFFFSDSIDISHNIPELFTRSLVPIGLLASWLLASSVRPFVDVFVNSANVSTPQTNVDVTTHQRLESDTLVVNGTATTTNTDRLRDDPGIQS